MLFVFIGLVAGLLLALSPHPVAVLNTPVDAVSTRLVTFGQHLVSAGVHATGARRDEVWVQVVATVVGVMIPGVVCLALTFAARGALGARRAVGALLLAAALLSFTVLPAGDALLLCVIAVLLGGLLSVLTAAALIAPMMLVATVLAVRTVKLVASGHSTPVRDGALALQHLAGGGSVGLWQVALAIVALAPIAGAARVLFHGKRSSDHTD